MPLPDSIPMSRASAIEGIMLAFVEASATAGIPAPLVHLSATSALKALGVTDAELQEWSRNVIMKALGINE